MTTRFTTLVARGGHLQKKCAYHESSTEGYFKYLKLTKIYLKRGFIYYILGNFFTDLNRKGYIIFIQKFTDTSVLA